MQPNRSNERGDIRGMHYVEICADMLVEDLNIPDALARRLCKRGVVTVGQLLTMSVDDLLRGYWIGKGSIQRIQNAIRELGLEPLGQHAPRQSIRRIV